MLYVVHDYLQTLCCWQERPCGSEALGREGGLASRQKGGRDMEGGR